MRRPRPLLFVICLTLGAMGCAAAPGPTPSVPPAVEPTPSGPVEPLGPTTSGGPMEMSGAGFAVVIPADWSVEVPGPDPDLARARPGDAWEALRAYAPDRRQTCSVYVAVATPDTVEWELALTPGLRAPRWTSSGAEPVLEFPHPRDRVEDHSGDYHVATASDYYTNDQVPERDVIYAVVCGADGELSFDSIIHSFELTPS